MIQTQDMPAHAAGPAPALNLETNFGETRCYFENHLVYLALSQRAKGLVIGINLNPGGGCNFNCVYCGASRPHPARDRNVNIKLLMKEFHQALQWTQSGDVSHMGCFKGVPQDLLKVKKVLISGDGEPTLCPNFACALEALVHERAQEKLQDYPLVLVTNASNLHLPPVQQGLRWLETQDEIWAKLDGGTTTWIRAINRTTMTCEHLLANITDAAREHSIIIQSLFPLLNQKEPSAEEINEYIQRLLNMQKEGAPPRAVQVYSAHQPTRVRECQHLPLQTLCRIARQIRTTTGLETEVF